MRDYRARLRAQGLRPVQFWVPDTRTPEFAKEAREQSLRIAASAAEADDLAFINAVFEEMMIDLDRDEAR